MHGSDVPRSIFCTRPRCIERFREVMEVHSSSVRKSIVQSHICRPSMCCVARKHYARVDNSSREWGSSLRRDAGVVATGVKITKYSESKRSDIRSSCLPAKDHQHAKECNEVVSIAGDDWKLKCQWLTSTPERGKVSNERRAPSSTNRRQAEFVQKVRNIFSNRK